MNIAYELREAYAGTVTLEDVEVDRYQGGVIAYGPDGSLDVKQALEAGGGRIVVPADPDPALIRALDEYPALKRVSAGDAEPTVDASAGSYADRKADELKADATARGIEGASSARKDDLITALEEYDRRLADESLVELAAPLTVESLAAAAAEREEA